MGAYKLDDGPGLFGFSTSNPSKVLENGSEVILQHFKSFRDIKMKVTSVGEKKFKVKQQDDLSSPEIEKDDYIVFRNDPQGEDYVICATVSSVDSQSPLEFEADVETIEKMKGCRKAKRFNVSLMGEVKIIGVADVVPVVVKKASMDAVKISCSEDVMTEDMLNTEVKIDEKRKFIFRGKVVKKSKNDGGFDYGLEVYDMTDGNKKTWYSYLMDLEMN